jgi:hypothetical protein
MHTPITLGLQVSKVLSEKCTEATTVTKSRNHEGKQHKYHNLEIAIALKSSTMRQCHGTLHLDS